MHMHMHMHLQTPSPVPPHPPKVQKIPPIPLDGDVCTLGFLPGGTTGWKSEKICHIQLAIQGTPFM